MTAQALQLRGEAMRQKYVGVTMATRKQDDDGETPIMLHVDGPRGATKVYAPITLAEAKRYHAELGRAIQSFDATEREQASK